MHIKIPIEMSKEKFRKYFIDLISLSFGILLYIYSFYEDGF